MRQEDNALDGELRDLLGAAAAEEVAALDARFLGRSAPALAGELTAAGGGTRPEYDVLLAGGGLSLLYAVALARRGLRVAVADPRGAARGHREWNASPKELRALVTGGAIEEAELPGLIVARYRRGIVRFQGGPSREVTGVLDAAVDAQGLLDRLKARAAALGVEFLDGNAVIAHRVAKGGVTASLRDREGKSRTVTVRLLLDGRGASSPEARWDLVCPTVGGVLAGLARGKAQDEVDEETGEILVTLQGAEGGTQPVWEGFPGRDGELTAYLFEYREPHRLPRRPLAELFVRFFRDLPTYKRGNARLVRPAFGFIPAYTRLRERSVAPSDRVLLVGDAAARHSPLTLCGFGSAIRSYAQVSDRLAQLFDNDVFPADALARCSSEHPSLSVQGGLALMMMDRGGLDTANNPQAINQILDAAFGALHAQGDEAFRAFLQDQATPSVLWKLLRGTAKVRPQVYGEAMRNLTRRELLTLTARFASFAASPAPAPDVAKGQPAREAYGG